MENPEFRARSERALAPPTAGALAPVRAERITYLLAHCLGTGDNQRRLSLALVCY